MRSLAWLELNRGNYGSAIVALEDGLGRVKDPIDLLVPLADLLVQIGETGRTEAIVKKLEGRPSESSRLQLKYLKGRLAMRANEWATAQELFAQLRTESAKLPALEQQSNLLLSVCYQRLGDSAQEQGTLKLILNKDPNHNAARVTLAQSYLNAGRTAEAVKEYQTAVQSPYAAPTTHASLLRLKAREYKLNQAKATDWQQLDRVAIELAKAYPPGASEPVLLRVELMEARGDRAQAVVLLRNEVARRPGDGRLWAVLAEKVATLVGVHAAFGVLDEGQASAGDGPDLRLARADLSARDPSRLRPIRPLAEGIDTWSDADQMKLLFGLVEIFDRTGDDAEVVRIYQRITARRPTDIAAWELLGERATRSGDANATQIVRTTLANLDASGKSLALADAWNAIAAKQPEPARPAIENLAKFYGVSPVRADVCVALARLNLLTGNRNEAGRLFERAVRLEPLRFPPQQAYLAFLATTGADEPLLNRLTRDHRWVGEPFRRAVRGAVRELAPEQARQLIGHARPFVDREPGGLGWLGDTYAAAGCSAEAGEAYRAAVDQPNATADDWLQLAIRTTASDRPKVLEAAAGKLSAPFFYAMAAAFAESPNTPKNWEPTYPGPAERKLFTQARLALKLSQFQRSESIALLDRYLASQPPAADAAWARRNQAMLLAVRGGAGDRAKAMQLLATSEDVAGESPEEKRSTAAVLTLLSRFVDGADRKAVLERATRVLKELAAETKSPRDEFLLARLYRASGDRTASIATLNRLLQSDPKNLEFNLAAVEDFAEAGAFEAGEPVVQRLLSTYPTDFRVLSAAARFECQAGQPEKARELAESYLRTADPAAGDLPGKSARVAELLDELARRPNVRKTPAGKAMIASAIEKYESLVQTKPEAIVPLVGLIALDDRPAEAFARIEKAGTAVPAGLRTTAGLAVLRVGGGSIRQFDTVKSWLDQALSLEPDSTSLKLAEGEFFALRQDYPTAEKAYQAVLDKDPRNVVALNNLAWILAPRPESAARALELVDRAVGEIGLTGELLDTRARVRIAAKQFDLAEKDLVEALTQDKTALRMFHLALAKQGQTPPRPDEARAAFRKAKDRGLEPKAVHPADLPMYRAFEADRGN